MSTFPRLLEELRIPILIPFSVLASINPITITQSVHIASILRDLTLTAWRQSFFVNTPNSGSDYWSIVLQDSAGNLLSTFDTLGHATGVWTYSDPALILPSVVANSAIVIVARGIKSGSPGSLSIAGPWVEAILD